MIHQSQKIFIFGVGFPHVVKYFDDGTLTVSVKTVGILSLLVCASDSKLGRCESASPTTISHLGSYSTEKLYSVKKDIHLVILCERCGPFSTVLSDAWSV